MGLLVSLVAALPLLGALGAAGTLRLTDTTTAYLRSRVLARGAAFDVDTMPDVDLGLRWRRAQVSLRYAPQLTFRNVAGEDEFTLMAMHNAALVVSAGGRRLRLQVAQTLSIGRWNLGALTPLADRDPTTPDSATTARGTLLPYTETLRLRSEQTSASATYAWSRRVRSELRGSYGLYGGAPGESRRYLPLQYTGAVSLSVGVLLTRRQQLESTLSGSHVSTSNDYEHWVATLGQAWSMRLARTTSTSLALGAFVHDSHLPDGSRRTGVVPAGAASLSHGVLFHRVRTTLMAGGSVIPFFNMITGDLQTSLQASASASVQRRYTTGVVMVDALQTLPLDAQRMTRLVGGGVRFVQRVGEPCDLFAGVRVQHQEVAGLELSVPWQWSIHAGATVRAPTLSF